MSDHTTAAAGGISRRVALGALGTAGVAPFFAGSAALASQTGALGWDQAAGRYTLPTLPYAYDALEPAIDQETMTIHHAKHHAGYVRGLNNAIAKLAEARDAGDTGLIKHWSRELAFHGSGHINHVLFWHGMAPVSDGGGGEPEGHLAMTIERDFGSFAKFVEHFKAASGAVEGSGWGWLVFEPTAGKLLVMQAEKHQDLTIWGAQPLLGVDVWEHAYYLRYQNRRSDYVDAFMSVVNWPEIAQRFDRARGAVKS